MADDWSVGVGLRVSGQEGFLQVVEVRSKFGLRLIQLVKVVLQPAEFVVQPSAEVVELGSRWKRAQESLDLGKADQVIGAVQTQRSRLLPGPCQLGSRRLSNPV